MCHWLQLFLMGGKGQFILHTLKPPNIRHTLVGNKIFDHSDVVKAAPTSDDHLSALLWLHLHSQLNTYLQWTGQRQLQDAMRNISVLGFGAPYIRGLTVVNRLSNKCYDSVHPIFYKEIPKHASKLIEAEWRIYASEQHTCTNIVSDNGPLPVLRQAVIWTNAAILSSPTKHIDGLVQERCNSIATALELHLSCTNPSVFQWNFI